MIIVKKAGNIQIIKRLSVQGKRPYLILLILFISLLNVIWLHKDTTPQGWDESIHLKIAEQFRQADVNNFFDVFTSSTRYYPPFVHMVGSVSGRIFGNSADGYTYTMLLFYILLILSVYLFTEIIFDSSSALAASFMVVSYPVIINEGHFFMLDMPLAAMVMLFAYFIKRTEKFTNWLFCALAGIVAGAGMLTKWTFAIYMFVPLILEAYSSKNVKGKAILNYVIFFVCFIAICGYWYVQNGLTAYNTLKFAAYSGADLKNAPSVFSFEGIKTFMVMFPDIMSIELFILLLMSIGFMVFDKENRKLLLCFLVPAIIFMLIKNRKDRYLMPILPFAAVISSYFIYKIQNLKFREIVLFVVIAITTVIFMLSSFRILPSWPVHDWPSDKNWKLENILNDIDADAGKKVRLCIVPDFRYMNNYTMSFLVLTGRHNINITEYKHFPYLSDYVLVKDGPTGSDCGDCGERLKTTMDLINEKDKNFKIMANYELPDGSKAELFKKIALEPDDKTICKAVAEQLNWIKGLNYKIVRGNGNKINLDIKGNDCVIGRKIKDINSEFRVKHVDLFIEDLGFLKANNRIVLSTFNKIKINKIEVTKVDLEEFSVKYGQMLGNNENYDLLSAFIRYRVNKLARPVITFENGNIVYSGERKNRNYKYAVRLSLDRYNVPRFEYKNYNISGFPLPLYFVDPRIHEYNGIFDEGAVSSDLYEFSSIKVNKNEIIFQ
jgi:hypothetical protein